MTGRGRKPGPTTQPQPVLCLVLCRCSCTLLIVHLPVLLFLPVQSLTSSPGPTPLSFLCRSGVQQSVLWGRSEISSLLSLSSQAQDCLWPVAWSPGGSPWWRCTWKLWHCQVPLTMIRNLMYRTDWVTQSWDQEQDLLDPTPGPFPLLEFLPCCSTDNNFLLGRSCLYHSHRFGSSGFPLPLWESPHSDSIHNPSFWNETVGLLVVHRPVWTSQTVTCLPPSATFSPRDSKSELITSLFFFCWSFSKGLGFLRAILLRVAHILCLAYGS